MSRRSIAAAIICGMRSGVQANAGIPKLANAAALSWSKAGAPRSSSANKVLTDTPERSYQHGQRLETNAACCRSSNRPALDVIRLRNFG